MKNKKSKNKSDKKILNEIALPVVHSPVNSVYLPNFHVVSERRGDISFFPHTGQIPKLLRALNLEFKSPLPPRIARVDRRATGFHKFVRYLSAIMFCNLINSKRADDILLYPLVDYDLVTNVAIAQQIVRNSELGHSYQFRFYSGENFTEIYLAGKRVIFSGHVFDRFMLRANNAPGAELNRALLHFFGPPVLDMPMRGRGLITSYRNSILAFPFKETSTEFFVTSCLTVNEINSLEVEHPTRALNFNFEPSFLRPKVRHWFPTRSAENLKSSWERKTQIAPRISTEKNWSPIASKMIDYVKSLGHGEGTRVIFTDNMPGPSVHALKPGAPTPCLNEEEIYQNQYPEFKWEGVFAERYQETSSIFPTSDISIS